MGNMFLRKLTSGILAATFVATIGTLPTVAKSTDAIDCGIDIVSAVDDTDVYEKEIFISDFVESTGNWNEWTSYYADSVKEMYVDFVNDINNLNNYVGILTVSSARVIDIQKVNSDYVPVLPELASYIQAGNYDAYLVAMDIDAKENSEYFYDGINYKLVILVNDGKNWKIGAQINAPEEIYSKESRGIGYGLLTPGSTPTTINVRDSSGIVHKNVNFTSFIKNVCQNEIGNMNYQAAAVKANAMAIKMAGWWAKVAKYRDTYGADIMYGDVAYVPGTTSNASVNSAVNAIANYRCVSSAATGSKLFFTSYFAGSSNDSGKASGRLRQNGSNYLANNGYGWQDILHYYYDNSSYNNPNVGIVRIY